MHRIRSWARAHASSRSPSALANAKPHDGQTTEKSSPPQRDANLKSAPENVVDAGTSAGPEKADVKQNPVVRLKNATIRFVQHTKDAICYSWVNVLLVFVPVGIAVEAVHLSPGLIFAMNALAIIPLAGLLSHATESVASRLGDTVGALLNVTFGNAVELIIFIALVKNEIRIVQASLLGSILANLLLILGMSFLLGGLRFQEQVYNNTVTQMSACLLSLSVTSLLLPTAFHASWSNNDNADRYTLKVSRGTSVVLLLVYVLYILFQLKSHAYLYASVPQQIIDEESHPGILADVMGGSSSSDSSSSSEDDSDDSDTSRITAKRLKKAIKRRTRRRSSGSSKAAASRSSVLASATDDNTDHVDDAPSGTKIHHATAGDDEARHDADDEAQDINEPRVRDFEQHPSSSTDPQQPSKATKSGRSRRHKKVKSAEGTNGTSEADAVQPIPLSTSISQPATRPSEMPNEAGRAPDTPKRKSALGLRSAVPALLSNTVFSSSNTPPIGSYPGTVQSMYPGEPMPVRRTNSMPARINRAAPQVVNAVQYARSAARVPRTTDPTTAEAPAPELEMSRTAAVVMLLLSTGLVAVCAEFLVDSIPAMVEHSAVSEAFIGLIILPIVGNAAEHVTAVSVATKNKMDLSIGVSVGSSIQIAIFVTPLVVILGWCMNKEMTLYFTLFETISLFVTAFVVNFLVLDGRSNYLEGALLIAAYVIIAVAAFFYPDGSEANSLGSP